MCTEMSSPVDPLKIATWVNIILIFSLPPQIEIHKYEYTKIILISRGHSPPCWIGAARYPPSLYCNALQYRHCNVKGKAQQRRMFCKYFSVFIFCRILIQFSFSRSIWIEIHDESNKPINYDKADNYKWVHNFCNNI